jgi:hypothetical protein
MRYSALMIGVIHQSAAQRVSVLVLCSTIGILEERKK